MSNNREEKAQFFSLYWGQDVGMREYGKQTRFIDANFMKYPDESYLLLKPLSAISDEHAIEFAILLQIHRGNYKIENLKKVVVYYLEEITEPQVDDHEYSSIDFALAIKIADILRSHSYALAWRGYSVQQQLEMGWIKLEEG